MIWGHRRQIKRRIVDKARYRLSEAFSLSSFSSSASDRFLLASHRSSLDSWSIYIKFKGFTCHSMETEKLPARESWQRVFMSRVDSLIKSQHLAFCCLLSFTLWPLNYSGRLSRKNDIKLRFWFRFFCFRRSGFTHEKWKITCKRDASSFSIQRNHKTQQDHLRCAIPGKSCANKTLAVFHLFDETSSRLTLFAAIPSIVNVFSEKSVWPKMPMLCLVRIICKRESY